MFCCNLFRFNGMFIILALAGMVGCVRSNHRVPIPKDFHLLLHDCPTEMTTELLEHWSKSVDSAIRDDLPFLEWVLPRLGPASYLSLHPLTQEKRAALAVWPVGETPVESWMDQAKVLSEEFFRRHPLQQFQKGEVVVWVARKSGYWLLSPHRSLLQDALLVGGTKPMPDGEYLHFRNIDLPWSDEGIVVVDSSGLRLRSTWYRPEEAHSAPPSGLPAFLTAGVKWIHPLPNREPPQPEWMAKGYQIAGQGAETFLFWIDSVGLMMDYWNTLGNNQGILQDFEYQGFRVRQLLDQSWSAIPDSMGWAPMTTPYLVQLGAGWVLASTRQGIERWIDYWIAGVDMNTRCPTSVKPSALVFWSTIHSTWGQQLVTWLGPLLPKGSTLYGYHIGTGEIGLAGDPEAEKGIRLLWQSRILDGPIRLHGLVGQKVWLTDRNRMMLLDPSGQLWWQCPKGKEVVVGGDVSGAYTLLVTDKFSRIIDGQGEEVAKVTLSPLLGSLRSWTHRLDSDGRLRVFLMGRTGTVQVHDQQGNALGSWFVHDPAPRAMVALRSSLTDVVVVFGDQDWWAYSLSGKPLWRIPAPGNYRNHITGIASPAVVVNISEGRIIELSIDGRWQEWGVSGDLLPKLSGGRVLMQSGNQATVWTVPELEGDFEPFRQVEKTGKWVDFVWTEEGWYGLEQNGPPWKVVGYQGGDLFQQSFPGVQQPVMVAGPDGTLVLIEQSDRIVAYLLP